MLLIDPHQGVLGEGAGFVGVVDVVVGQRAAPSLELTNLPFPRHVVSLATTLDELRETYALASRSDPTEQNTKRPERLVHSP